MAMVEPAQCAPAARDKSQMGTLGIHRSSKLCIFILDADAEERVDEGGGSLAS